MSWEMPDMPFSPEFFHKRSEIVVHAHLLFRHEIERDARVDLSAAGAHRKPVERGEPHGRGDCAPVMDGAHRGAVAEMGDDDGFARDLRRDRAQLLAR